MKNISSRNRRFIQLKERCIRALIAEADRVGGLSEAAARKIGKYRFEVWELEGKFKQI